jgi:hypothetical protein
MKLNRSTKVVDPKPGAIRKPDTLRNVPEQSKSKMESSPKRDGGAIIMQETADQYRQRMFSYLNGGDPLNCRLRRRPSLQSF